MVNDLNVGVSERVRAVIAGLFTLSLLMLITGIVPFYIFILMTFLTLYANKDITMLFYRRKGLLFAIGGFLFHQFYYLYSSTAFAWVMLEKTLGIGAFKA